MDRNENITISVEDDLYRAAHIKAAEQATSVSGLFKAYLIQITEHRFAETEFQRLERGEQEIRAELRTRRLGLNPANNLGRDELHDRHALR